MSDRANQEQRAVLAALAVFDDNQTGNEASRAIDVFFLLCLTAKPIRRY
jgi:hypothetical protein